MGKRSRLAPAASRQPLALPGEPQVRAAEIGAFGSWGAGGGWNGADWSRNRGYVYWPQEDTRRDLSSYSLAEMRRRSRYLDANVGFAGRINQGLARMVAGTGLMPSPGTADTEWNRLRADLYEQRNGSAAVVDLGRRWDAYSMQRGMLRCRYRDGDIGAIATESVARLARLAFIEGHRLGNGRVSAERAQNIFDGVLVDRNNAATAYRVLGDAGEQVDVPVENFFYLGDYSSPGRHRTPPISHRALNHLLDRTEIDGAVKKGIKNASRIGYYIGKDAQKVDAGLPGLKRSVGDRQATTLPSGRKVDIEKVLDGGGEIPDLEPGQEIKTLLDSRPHPNVMGFYDHLARDICWGIDIAPEVLWNIAALGGANTRYVMAEAQSFVEVEQQNLIDSVLARWYFYDTRKEIAAGRLRECRDPQWWKHGWIPPTRWTVDRGKDGKLHLEQVRSGALTFRRMLGWEGLDARRELTEWMDEIAWIAQSAKDRGLDAEKTLDRIYGRPGTPAAPVADPAAARAAAEDDDDDPPARRAA